MEKSTPGSKLKANIITALLVGSFIAYILFVIFTFKPQH